MIDPINKWLERSESYRREHGRPMVSLCFAQSLDGSLTYRRGRPMELSGPGAMALTHDLRAAHDAILVGIGTVLADDPSLTARLVDGKDPQPVVLDSRLRMSLDARLIKENSSSPWIITTPGSAPGRRPAFKSAGVRLIDVPYDPHDCLQLPYTLERLAESGISSLMVEGGAQVITSFLSEGLVDFAVVTICPIFVGGLRALEGTINPNEHLLKNNFPSLQEVGHQRLGDDLIIWGKVVA